MSSPRHIPGYKNVDGVWVKDETAVAVNPSLPRPSASSEPSAPKDPAIDDISIDDLLAKNLLILYRETRQLLIQSAAGKLSPDSSRCVRDNISLLQKLKQDEKDILDDMTEEELRAELEKRQNEA